MSCKADDKLLKLCTRRDYSVVYGLIRSIFSCWGKKRVNWAGQISEPKRCLFTEISGIHMPFTRLTKKKEGCKWNQKWKRWHYNWWHRNKKRMIRDYCEQLYSSKLGKLEGMEAFLETYTQPRLNHEDMENLSRLATSQEIESIIKNVPQKKSPGPDGFTENSTKHLKKN